MNSKVELVPSLHTYGFFPMTTQTSGWMMKMNYKKSHVFYYTVYHVPLRNVVGWRKRVYRRPGKRYKQCNTVGTVHYYGGGSVMVWDGINVEARTELVRIDHGRLTSQRCSNCNFKE
uniref:Uncharacterized protein LOC114326891 n=1 Tax=Diabrotica virgifera virgifera TaxID=50390 RepID=A0A6P7FCI3_DIAVI